jgi:hypothetical protein
MGLGNQIPDRNSKNWLQPDNSKFAQQNREEPKDKKELLIDIIN